ncbi:MAG: nucleoside hydrolase [Ginsengibacter sp.]
MKRFYNVPSSAFFVTLALTVICSSGVAQSQVIHVPVKIVFETDMGNDIDDAIALAMLYRYAGQGKAELLAISNNKQSINSVRFIDLMNRWYHYPNIPIGTVQNGKSGEDESKSFAKKVIDHSINSKKVFKSKIRKYTDVKESVNLYRQILSVQPDKSVVIISVGFFTNLARLLESEPDQFSSLNGMDLIKKKVKYLSVMAGNFSQPVSSEFNIINDISAATKVYELWPGTIYSSPFEVGNNIHFPSKSIEMNLGYVHKNPLVEGYKLYNPMPYDRPTWDPTAVLFALEPKEGYFTLSKPGSIKVNKEGVTSFTENKNGNQFYLMTPDLVGKQKILSRFIELVNAVPKSISEKKN